MAEKFLNTFFIPIKNKKETNINKCIYKGYESKKDEENRQNLDEEQCYWKIKPQLLMREVVNLF